MAEIDPRSFTLRDGRGVVIRSANPDDAPAVLTYLPLVRAESPYVATHPDDPVFDEAAERAFFAKHREADNCVFLLAETPDGEIIGTLGFSGSHRIRERHAGMLGVSLREAWRGQGLGRAMMETLLTWARQCDVIERVALTVMAINEPAIQLYRSLGFVEEGVMRRTHKRDDGGYSDTLIMAIWVGPDQSSG